MDQEESAIAPIHTACENSFVKFFDLDLDTYRLSYEARPVPRDKSQLIRATPTPYGVSAVNTEPTDFSEQQPDSGAGDVQLAEE